MVTADLHAGCLLSERIHLIPPSAVRVDEMHTLIANFGQLHSQFLDWVGNPPSPEKTSHNMQVAIKNFSEGKEEYKFLIVDNQTENLLGCISLFIRNPLIPFFEIGYWLGNGAMGKGFATEACALIKTIALDFFNAKRLEIRTAKRNTRSIRVAERAGFQLEAILVNERIDKNGELDDTCIYVCPKLPK